jgi:hypothetical protein
MLEDESTPGPQCGRKDYVNGKIPMTPSGIEDATFQLVAQCHNQLLQFTELNNSKYWTAAIWLLIKKSPHSVHFNRLMHISLFKRQQNVKIFRSLFGRIGLS